MTHIVPGWNWYLAELVLESRIQNEVPIVQIESVLVYALSAEEAYEKTAKLCSSSEHVYRNHAGRSVEQNYIGIRDLDNLQVEELRDGLTLSVRQTDESRGTEAGAFVRSREELALFRDRSRYRTNLDQ